MLLDEALHLFQFPLMTKRTLLFLLIGLFAFHDAGALTLKNPGKKKESGKASVFPSSLSEGDVVRGLKEALIFGAKNAANLASQVDGFYKNPLIFIPFPPEAKQMKSVLERIGLKSQVDKFVETLNRAAEEAAKKAAPIFLDAIKSLTIEDGFQILKGGEDAATRLLQRKTTGHLTTAFRPVVGKAIDTVQVTRYWTPLASNYNRVPLVKKVNPDLETYVTERAIDGLFKLIANEEKKIRKNPAERITDLLRRVFGS